MGRRYRWTGPGVKVGPLTTSWAPTESDREIARRVLNLLEDRRMLWRDYSLEIEEHCVKSAAQTRRDLGVHLDNRDIGGELAAQVRTLQGLFRAFMDEVPHVGDQWPEPHRGYGTDPLSMALGKLRALVGLQVATLASTYGLEVSEDLAIIVPDEGAWFFEPDTASGLSQ